MFQLSVDSISPSPIEGELNGANILSPGSTWGRIGLINRERAPGMPRAGGARGRNNRGCEVVHGFEFIEGISGAGLETVVCGPRLIWGKGDLSVLPLMLDVCSFAVFLNEGDPMNARATANDDLQAIRKLGEEFFSAVAAADLDRRMATMDPDAVIMPPDRPSIVGKEEIRRLSYDYSAVFQEKCSVVYDEVETVGDWGFVRATVTGTRTYKSGGGVENVSLKNLWIVKRQADGQWKFWRIMFNNTPLAVASGR